MSKCSHLHDRIIRYYTEQSLSVSEIKKTLNISRDTVIVILKKAGVYRSQNLKRDKLEKKVIELHAQGKNNVDIALILGKSAANINACCKKLGLQSNTTLGTDIQKEKDKKFMQLKNAKESQPRSSFNPRHFLKED